MYSRIRFITIKLAIGLNFSRKLPDYSRYNLQNLLICCFVSETILCWLVKHPSIDEFLKAKSDASLSCSQLSKEVYKKSRKLAVIHLQQVRKSLLKKLMDAKRANIKECGFIKASESSKYPVIKHLIKEWKVSELLAKRLASKTNMSSTGCQKHCFCFSTNIVCKHLLFKYDD